MHKYIRVISLVIIFLSSSPVFPQSLDGLKEIITLQQEKIARIENELKNLIGSFESLSNQKQNNKIPLELESKINSVAQKLNLLENNIKNITNLSYNLDFALKRIERHLDLTSINNGNIKQSNKEDPSKPTFVENKNNDINVKNLEKKTESVLGFIKEPTSSSSDNNKQNDVVLKSDTDKDKLLTKSSPEENYNIALDYAVDLDFVNAEKAFKEFLTIYKDDKQTADAQYWLGRVYFAQGKFEEAAIALAEFNSVFPNDSRFQETTLLIAESASNFAPQNQLCDILKQSLEFMVNPSEKFIKRINDLKNENKCTNE
jgi:TolA-binding protein